MLRPRVFIYAVSLAAITGLLGQESYVSVPPVDSPELAHRGSYGVGVRTLELVNPGQVDLLSFNREAGKAPLYDRRLKVEVWYPAVIPAGQKEHTEYESALPNAPRAAGAPASFKLAGKALRDATPAQGAVFPLVIVSHGYPGSRTFLSYLTENLASKGYVVAAIDHTDSVWGEIKPFPSTLVNRTKDQIFTLDALTERSRQAGDFLNGLVDASKVAIVGYSMGGYGALASAGAGYSKSGVAAKMVPGGLFDDVTAGSPGAESRRRPALKAVVAIAPWGAQPPMSSWDATGLAAIRIPSLFIAGDQDDVSGYAQGIRPAFDKAVNSERCLLVYQNANHNVGGNPPPAEALARFQTREFFDEPVWRKDRIAAINQHFITAFLDLYLKGDESRRAYLKLAVARSNDGKWPMAPGQSAGDSYSVGDQKTGQTYWKGFQRRWALGLEMHCADAGSPAVAAGTAEIEELEKSWVRAVVEGNGTELERLLADDLVYAHASGVVDTKASYLAKIREKRQIYKSLEQRGMTYRLKGDVAITHGWAHVTGTNPQGLFDDKVMMTHTWVKTPSGWRLGAHQTTKVAELP